MIYAFFGHSYIEEDFSSKLKRIILECYENDSDAKFYVGNHGMFDKKVCKMLEILKMDFPNLNYYVVLAYLPEKGRIL